MTVQLLETSTDNLVEQIAWVARVSNPGNRINKESSEKLVDYLVKHKHWSPFEMFSLCLEIKTTRDIGRQILRHRSFSFQEFSQRYAVVDEPFHVRETRLQDAKNRQSSNPSDDKDLNAYWEEAQAEVALVSQDAYSWAIDNNIAKEQARVVLPEGMTPTTMLMSGTLRSWIHYIELRTEAGTQKEHRDIAHACAEAIKPQFPMIGDFVHEV